MVEYIAYVVENFVPRHIIGSLFEAQNIKVNTVYINSVIELQRLYLSIRNMYNDPVSSKQFINALKQSILDKKVETFTDFPQADVFIRFYSLFYDLIYPPKSYRFEGILDTKLDINVPIFGFHVDNLSFEGDFIIAQTFGVVYVWNTKTTEVKEFRFQNSDSPRTDFSFMYEKDKF